MRSSESDRLKVMRPRRRRLYIFLSRSPLCSTLPPSDCWWWKLGVGTASHGTRRRLKSASGCGLDSPDAVFGAADGDGAHRMKTGRRCYCWSGCWCDGVRCDCLSCVDVDCCCLSCLEHFRPNPRQTSLSMSSSSVVTVDRKREASVLRSDKSVYCYCYEPLFVYQKTLCMQIGIASYCMRFTTLLIRIAGNLIRRYEGAHNGKLSLICSAKLSESTCCSLV